MSSSRRLAAAIDVLRRDPDTPTLEQHTVRGLPVLVHNSRPDISTTAALGRLDQALELIERHTPERLARLREDFTAFLVRRWACRGAYFPAIGVCLVELTFLVHPDITPAQVGASIVHEAVHAHLRAVGIRAGSQVAAAEEERRCREAEIEFGLRVPGGEAVVERARGALALGDEDVAPTVDWELARRRVQEVDRKDPRGP